MHSWNYCVQQAWHAKICNAVIRFKANDVDPVFNTICCYGTNANFSAWSVRNLMRGNVEHYRLFCVITHSLHLKVRWRENPRVLVESSPRLPRHHVCVSDRQSNMAAIYTHWVRWKLRWITQAPLVRENWKEDRQSRGKACKFLSSGLSGMLSCADSQQQPGCVSARDADTLTLLLIQWRGPLMFKVLYLLCMSVLSYHFQRWE